MPLRLSIPLWEWGVGGAYQIYIPKIPQSLRDNKLEASLDENSGLCTVSSKQHLPSLRGVERKLMGTFLIEWSPKRWSSRMVVTVSCLEVRGSEKIQSLRTLLPHS